MICLPGDDIPLVEQFFGLLQLCRGVSRVGSSSVNLSSALVSSPASPCNCRAGIVVVRGVVVVIRVRPNCYCRRRRWHRRRRHYGCQAVVGVVGHGVLDVVVVVIAVRPSLPSSFMSF